MKTILIILLLCTPIAAQTPKPPRFSWQGEYVGFQRIADTRQPFARGQYATTFLSIIGLGKKNSFQFQVIVPIGAGYRAPIYRIAIDRRIF